MHATLRCTGGQRGFCPVYVEDHGHIERAKTCRERYHAVRIGEDAGIGTPSTDRLMTDRMGGPVSGELSVLVVVGRAGQSSSAAPAQTL